MPALEITISKPGIEKKYYTVSRALEVAAIFYLSDLATANCKLEVKGRDFVPKEAHTLEENFDTVAVQQYVSTAIDGIKQQLSAQCPSATLHPFSVTVELLNDGVAKHHYGGERWRNGRLVKIWPHNEQYCEEGDWGSRSFLEELQHEVTLTGYSQQGSWEMGKGVLVFNPLTGWHLQTAQRVEP